METSFVCYKLISNTKIVALAVLPSVKKIFFNTSTIRNSGKIRLVEFLRGPMI